MTEVSKPPLGVMPRDAFEQRRLEALAAAILSHLESGDPFPDAWLEEFVERAGDRNHANKAKTP
jgi:hypothetical protein